MHLTAKLLPPPAKLRHNIRRHSHNTAPPSQQASVHGKLQPRALRFSGQEAPLPSWQEAPSRHQLSGVNINIHNTGGSAITSHPMAKSASALSQRRKRMRICKPAQPIATITQNDRS